MNTHPDFSRLWKEQPASVPDLHSFFRFVRAYRKKQSLKRWKTNVLLGATVIFTGCIIRQIDQLEWLTFSGALLVMMAVLLYLIMYNRIFLPLGAAGYRDNNRDFLQHLLVFQRRQRFLHRQGISGYYILLCSGLTLYMIPFIRRMTPLFAVVVIVLTAGWILFSWFYFRPRTISRETAALKAVMDECEKINQQWETPGEPE